jgi:hypothetical protein
MQIATSPREVVKVKADPASRGGAPALHQYRTVWDIHIEQMDFAVYGLDSSPVVYDHMSVVHVLRVRTSLLQLLGPSFQCRVPDRRLV